MSPMFNPMQNFPTIKELWKQEKSRYRLWMILFIVSLFIIFGISLTATILVISNKHNYALELENSFPNDKLNTSDYERFLVNQIIAPTIISAAALIAIVLFLPTLVSSYKFKSFEKLNSFSILFGIIVGLVSFIDLIWNIIDLQRYFATLGTVFVFTTSFFGLFLWFFSVKVNNIKRQFLISKRFQDIKNNPDFQKMQDQFQNMFNMSNPSGNQTNSNESMPKKDSASNAFGPSLEKDKNNVTKVENNIESKLNSLSISQLKEIAKELSISGYSTMKKNELIKVISRIKDFE